MLGGLLVPYTPKEALMERSGWFTAEQGEPLAGGSGGWRLILDAIIVGGNGSMGRYGRRAQKIAWHAVSCWAPAFVSPVGPGGSVDSQPVTDRRSRCKGYCLPGWLSDIGRRKPLARAVRSGAQVSLVAVSQADFQPGRGVGASVLGKPLTCLIRAVL